MAYPDDPDFSTVDALPDPAAAPKLSTELDALATAIKTTSAGIGTDAQGRTPDDVSEAANAAATATRDAATNAATAEAAIKLLKDAVAAWKKDAPKKVELDAAEKAVNEARVALGEAQDNEDAKRSMYNEHSDMKTRKWLDDAIANTQAKQKDLDTKFEHLRDLKAKRKDADAAYERERKKAAAKMKGLVGGGQSQHDGDSPGAPSTGAQSTGIGSGTGTQSTGTGSPAAKPTTGTPKPTTGSPTSQTPTTEKPSSTTGKGSDTDTAALATLLAAAQQQNQQGQGQQQAQPTAATQPQQQTPQTDKDKDKDKEKGQDAGKPIDVDDLIREGALPASAAAATLTGVGGGNPISTPAPVANTNSTTFRPAGTTIPGVNLGGTPAVNAQNPITSGNSQTGLHTASDVSGRSTPTASAFSPTPSGAETKTSGATGNTAQQASPLNSRGAGTGMPAMPMVPPMGGAAGGGGGGRSGDEAKPGVVRYEPGEASRHGEDTIRESVRGGTIAQNRPDSGTAA